MTELVTIKDVRAYIDEKGIAFLNLEDVARGLGFIKKDVKNGKEYIRIDKSRVLEYLEIFGKKFPKIEDEYIPENIFYKLCMKANNETARKFQDLVCDEILPTIRKTGGYIVANENDSDEQIMARAVLVAQKTIEKKNEKIKQLETKIEEQEPHVFFAKSVEGSENSTLIGNVAKLISQSGYPIGQNKLFAWLRDNGYLIKRKGESYNMPTQKSMDMGLFEIKERTNVNPDGSIKINKTPMVTGKGQVYFINIFKKIA